MSQGPDASGSPEPANLVHALLDLDLRTFAGPRLLKIMYLVGMVLLGLSALAGFVTWTANGGTGFLVGLFMVALMFLLLLVFRVFLELTKLLYRISENIAALAAGARQPAFTSTPALSAASEMTGPVIGLGTAASREPTAPVIAPFAPIGSPDVAPQQATTVVSPVASPTPSAAAAESVRVSSAPAVPAAPAAEGYPSDEYAAQFEFGRQAAYAAVEADYAARGYAQPVAQAADYQAQPGYPEPGYPAQAGYPGAEYAQARAEYQRAEYRAEYQSEYQSEYQAAAYHRAEYAQGVFAQGDQAAQEYARADYPTQVAYPAQGGYPQAGYAHPLAQPGQAPAASGRADYPQGSSAQDAYAQDAYAQADDGWGRQYTQAEYAQAEYAQAEDTRAEYTRAEDTRAGYAQQTHEGQAEHGYGA